ncbi:MAG: NAD-dependent epimerase/dehydratase family protein [Myxococcota bacterium]
MRVLVTGATGFIGRHLVREVAREGSVELLALVRSSSRVDALRRSGVTLVTGDVLDRGSLEAAVRGVDVVFHLAGLVRALRAHELDRVNRDGVRHLVEACASRQSPPALVLVSSLAAAGPSEDRPRVESDPPRPVSSYGWSKLAGENAAAGLAREVPITVVRPPIVFGASDRATGTLFRLVARGWHLAPGPDDRRYSLVHAEDLARMLMRAAERGERLADACEDPGRGRYFAAFDAAPTGRELGLLLARALGRERVRTLRPPDLMTWGTAALADAAAWITRRPGVLSWDKAREMTAGSWTCSSRKAERDLRFEPAAPLEERLRETAAWYRSEGWL